MSAPSDTIDRGKDELRHPARNARENAERGSGWYAWLARIGLVAKGVSYGIVGVLALELALEGEFLLLVGPSEAGDQ